MVNKHLTQVELETLKTYDSYAKEWVETYADTWSKERDQFQKYLPEGIILEIGSGAGVDAKELISRGYTYLGTDISLGLINEAKKWNPNAKFIHQSVYELNFPQNSFNGFWAVAVLLHVPKSKIDEALQKIHFVTKPNGVGLISLKKGVGEK